MKPLRVSDVMTTDLYAVAPDTSIETAARLLAARRITGAPVIDEAGTPIGVVSLVDLVDPDRHQVEDAGYPLFYRMTDGAPLEISGDLSEGVGRVSELMTPFVLSVKSSASLVDAARLMTYESVHRLLVLDGTRLVGIITSSDVLRGYVLSHTNREDFADTTNELRDPA